MATYSLSLQEAAEKEVAAKEAEEKASVKGKVTTYPRYLQSRYLHKNF
jgi:hypothetical protein